ncbi:MAG: type II secretion system F family protein [Candidatus Riflebacteria bacterium]|nr:type II secretion system F family protein [Candidatus Riflebacteria bacterium]
MDSREDSAIDLLWFTRRLSALVDTGLDVPLALDRVARGCPGTSLERVARHAGWSVARGSTLSGALTLHPDLFDPFYVGVVRGGEQTGTVNEALAKLVVALDRNRRRSSRVVRLAATYGGGAGVLSLLVAAFLFGFGPCFKSIYSSLNISIPAVTRALLWTSETVNDHPALCASLAALIVLVGVRLWQVPAMLELWSALIRRIPAVGPAARGETVARLCRQLHALLTTGVSATETLAILQACTPGPGSREALGRARCDLLRGESLSGALLKEKLVPERVAAMITLGEETGSLHEVLGLLAAVHARPQESLLRHLETFAVPALLIMLGLVVGAGFLFTVMPLMHL